MQTNGHSESASQRASRRGPRFSLSSGDRPLDGYTIKRGVGVGGFGEVYYATSDAGKEVALKRIQRNLDIELRGVRHCLNLKHVNLVALYDIKYDEEDQAWVVMEYVSGESLQDVIERNPNGMPLDQVNKWFSGIASGVAHLHDCGIVHRDIKPGNIFIDEGIVKIGDYGLSKFISCSRRSGQTQSVGTFHYMAPEIGQGCYGKEIDIYAMGIMLYEMLTGRVPFDGESSQEIIMKHLTARPELSGIIAPYREVIEQALAKDPAARSSSAAQMRDRILGVITAESVSPASPSLTNPSALAAATAAAAVGNLAGNAAAAAQANIPKMVNAAAVGGAAAGATYSDVRSALKQAPLPQEPIARLVRGTFRDVMANVNQMSGFGKLCVLVGTLFGLFFTSKIWAPVLVPALVLYGIYYVGRAFFLGLYRAKRRKKATPSTAAATGLAANVTAEDEPILAEPVHAVAKMKKKKKGRLANRQNPVLVRQRQLRSALKTKTFRQHLMELTGSYLLAALVCGIFGLLGFMFYATSVSSSIGAVAGFAWVTMTSTLAAWGVLFVSKWWESKPGDAVLRRFTMFIVGLLVGFASWAIAYFILQTQPVYLLPAVEGLALESAPNALYDAHDNPHMLGYVAYFGLLFVLLRWWRQADPIRASRFGIWRTGICLLGAVIVQAFFPMPGGFMIPLATAAAIQIAAPFVDAEERDLICGTDRAAKGGVV